jgi:hypothetical protein
MQTVRFTHPVNVAHDDRPNAAKIQIWAHGHLSDIKFCRVGIFLNVLGAIVVRKPIHGPGAQSHACQSDQIGLHVKLRHKALSFDACMTKLP